MIEVKVKKLRPEARVPTYAHPGDAGMDLYAVETTTIAAGSRGLVPTGIALAIPEGHVGLVWDKSSVPLNYGVTKMSGVLDSGYRGEIKLVLYNTSDTDCTFEAGQKVAQLLIQPVIQPAVVEVAELDSTSRGEGGFGSTGK